MLKTWNEFFNEKNFTKNDIISKGFIFSKFPEFFKDISIFPINDTITIEEQKINYDIDLYTELSDRYVSPEIDGIFSFFDSLSYDDFVKHLLIRINRNHYDNWKKLYNDFTYQYTLGKNYDLTETREVKHTGDVSRVSTNTGTVKDTSTNETDIKSRIIDNTTDGLRYAFNSTTPVHIDTTKNNNSGESNTILTVDRATANDLENNSTDTYNTTDTETLTRMGDLSVRAIQEQIQLDIDLWKKNVFYNIVLRDVLISLSLSIWKGGE